MEPYGTEQETIAHLRAEVERLRADLAGERFAQRLRQALTLAATTGAIAAPVTHSRLLEMIVETAAHVISAGAASLFLLDEAAGELIFEVALGQKAEEVKRFRVPLGHGIAGLVAVSGQPMAVSDASSDPRHAGDIARQVGYAPRNLLCVPLYYDDQVIGVLELLDKIGAPSFSVADTAALSLFANLAAVAIEQSRAQRNMVALMTEALRSLGDASAAKAELPAMAFAERLETDASYRRALELADLVQGIASQGEHEVALCRAVLAGIATYVRTRPDRSPDLGSF